MGTVNVSDYKDIYLRTAREYAESLSESCSTLASNPSDKDALTELHISSHSLRSQSQVMGYANISVIAWAIEKIARAVLEGKYNINERIISILKEAVVEINILVSDIEQNNKEKNLDYLVKKLDEVSKV